MIGVNFKNAASSHELHLRSITQSLRLHDSETHDAKQTQEKTSEKLNQQNNATVLQEIEHATVITSYIERKT